ncbi:MAG: CDP-alcohol phosphatidyltransferase family protein [Myxococcota bacterium]|nr:CDP-alcohol phosphatidyltransferase family protein [Myxococcota bacterium]
MPEVPRSGVWRTRANALTALRFAAAPACALSIACEIHGIALGLFALAVATDLVDGRVARRYGETSALGGLLDHVSDASFVALGCLALALRGELPWLLPPLIAIAFAQYVLDSRTPRRAERPREGWALRASALGRWNGIGYFVVLGIPVVRDGLSIGWPSQGLPFALGWVLVVSTLVSMADRLRTSRAARSARDDGSSRQ